MARFQQHFPVYIVLLRVGSIVIIIIIEIVIIIIIIIITRNL